MASIHRKGAGHRAQFYDGAHRLVRSPVMPTRAQAEDWLAEHAPKADGHRFVALLAAWIADEPHGHRKTREQPLAKLAADRGWTDVRAITVPALESWLKEVKAKRTEVRQAGERHPSHTGHLRYLMAMLRWSGAVLHAPVAPAVLLWKPKRRLRPVRRAKPPLLTDQQVAKVRETALGKGARAIALIDYLLTYAARPVTACRMRRGDLDPVRKELLLRDPKMRDSFRHPVRPGDLAWRDLAKWTTSEDAPLFPRPGADRAWREKHGSAQEMALWYRYHVAKPAGLPRELWGIYHLKRWALTRMLRSGLDPATAALFSGHRTLSQVLTYNTTNETAAKKALLILTPPPKARNPRRNPPIPANAS